VDTTGLVLGVVVHAADVQDVLGARQLLGKVQGLLPRLRLIWADGGYMGSLIEWVRSVCGWTLEIVKRDRHLHHFVVLPRRWVVERTFAWLGRYRRLSKDYEYLTSRSEAMIYLAMTQLMVRRLARQQAALGP